MTGTHLATPPGTTGIAWWQGGLTEQQIGREAGPDWARFTTQAVAAAPVTPLASVAGLSGSAGFARILAPFTDAAVLRLTSRQQPSPALLAGFAERLAARLVRLAARTLVLELHVSRVNGRLAGATPADRFADFVRQTATPDGLTRLFAEYPVLARLLAQACLHAEGATAELLERLAADRDLLVEHLWAGADPGPLVALEPAGGDGHRHGRAVAVLRFASGARAVYKPRPVHAHLHFNELAHWYNARLGEAAVPTVTVLARPGYGWVEHVSPEPCGSRRQLARFYRRQGALLALLHAVDGTDVHHENLIARADRPVLVDVETLFHPAATAFAPPAAGPPDPAAEALARSVRRTGLLPHLRLGEREGWDESGLGGDKGVLLPVDAVEFEGSGTDTMRLVRRPRTAAGAANRPTLDGRDADPAAFTEELLAGFRAGYRAIAAGAAELAGPHGPLHRFAADEVRVVVRASRSYARLLDESTHPDVLRAAGDRDRLLGLLREEGAAPGGSARLTADEVAQLWCGDIPLFTTRPDSADLWGSQSGPLPGLLGEPGLDRAMARVTAMDEEQLHEQEWVVRAALATRVVGLGSAGRPGPAGSPGSSRARAEPLSSAQALAAARRIGDRLLAWARHGHGRANWLGLELIDQRYWQLGPLGAGLADGYLGTALFLAQLSRISGDARYADTARRALAPVPALLAGLAAQPEQLGYVGTGAFTGLGGIAYALSHLAVELADPALADLVEPAVALAAAAVAADQDTTVLSGLAGGLAALLAVHRATGSAAARHAARACAERLLQAPAAAAPGFAHGRAGTGWALLAFAAQGGGGDFERAGLAALRSVPPGDGDASWCRGAAGTALALSDSPAALADPPLARYLERAVAALATADPLPDHSLCHGEFGVLELRSATGRPGLPDPTAAGSAPRCGTPGAVSSPGLLTGLAGIGHGLLRLGFPDRVPAVLLLRPPLAD
ncbi:type 2 lanthipeptide synthetase LanM family protein [Streptomyces tateyamensis]|nr:type 2 lanthipeptide synthetase LanM family protein [Streptomyces tateyamensis]